ncbi:MAG: tol-pal system protein YbgF [Deltaproteobacteria bacterium]|nr:tol-pal system protein YbgF [Deltaproteobacteria bacterium]
MKRRDIALLLCLGVLGISAGGCSLTESGAFVRLQEEVETVKKEVAAVKSSATSSPASGRIDAGELQAVRKNVADLTASYDQVKSDMVAATTRADETKVQMQKENAAVNDRLNEQGQTIQALRGKLAKLEELEKRLAAVEEKTEKLAAASPLPVATPVTTPQDWKSPEEMYDYALGLVKRGESRKGRELLTTFAAKYPDHKLMPNVLYWKGESFYAEKDFESAILSFQDVIDKHPAGDKAPDSMYKQGLSFLGLKDKKNARIVLELLVSKHPRSPAAALARQKLAELK